MSIGRTGRLHKIVHITGSNDLCICSDEQSCIGRNIDRAGPVGAARHQDDSTAGFFAGFGCSSKGFCIQQILLSYCAKITHIKDMFTFRQWLMDIDVLPKRQIGIVIAGVNMTQFRITGVS